MMFKNYVASMTQLLFFLTAGQVCSFIIHISFLFIPNTQQDYLLFILKEKKGFSKKLRRDSVQPASYQPRAMMGKPRRRSMLSLLADDLKNTQHIQLRRYRRILKYHRLCILRAMLVNSLTICNYPPLPLLFRVGNINYITHKSLQYLIMKD